MYSLSLIALARFRRVKANGQATTAALIWLVEPSAHSLHRILAYRGSLPFVDYNLLNILEETADDPFLLKPLVEHPFSAQ